MFAHLSGAVARIDAGTVVIDVGGVGYRVFVPVTVLSVLPATGQKTFLYIHTHIRAEEISLYGFASPEDQRVFELLIGVTGIGPKVALSILSAMDADSLARSVSTEDTKTLVRIPGLGMKIAQRLILELKDKLAKFALERRVDGQQSRKDDQPKAPDIIDDVTDGLVGLGYKPAEARKAAEQAVKDMSDKTHMPDALRGALKILTGVGK